MMMFDFWRVTPKKRRVKIRKGGVIYSNPGGKRRIVFKLGNILIVLAIGYFVYLYYPLAVVVVEYKMKEEELIVIEKMEPVVAVKKAREVNLDDFGVRVTKIKADAKVKAKVSAYNKEEYLAVLKDDVVAHARDSDLPGDGPDSTIYLFAHSTHQGLGMVRKNAVFYLLGELVAGDMIEVDFSGKTYRYQVYDEKIVEAKEVEYMEYGRPERETLIMQTCWPLGTNWKRLLVFAQLVEVI